MSNHLALGALAFGLGELTPTEHFSMPTKKKVVKAKKVKVVDNNTLPVSNVIHLFGGSVDDLYGTLRNMQLEGKKELTCTTNLGERVIFHFTN